MQNDMSHILAQPGRRSLPRGIVGGSTTSMCYAESRSIRTNVYHSDTGRDSMTYATNIKVAEHTRSKAERQGQACIEVRADSEL